MIRRRRFTNDLDLPWDDREVPPPVTRRGLTTTITVIGVSWLLLIAVLLWEFR